MLYNLVTLQRLALCKEYSYDLITTFTIFEKGAFKTIFIRFDGERMGNLLGTI